MAVVIFPRIGEDERELIVGDSDNRSIFIVQFEEPFVRLPTDLGQ